MSQPEVIQILITAIAGILVPVALLVIGNWYTKQKDRAEADHRHANRVALLPGHLVWTRQARASLQYSVQ